MRKVKSAFLRDQAPDTEKCLVYDDLLTGPARNWQSANSIDLQFVEVTAGKFHSAIWWIWYACWEAILPREEEIG